MTQEEYVSDAVDLLKKLIATPSVSRNEKDAADIMEQTIRKYGQLLSEEYTEEGIKVTAYVPAELFAGLYGDGSEEKE